MKNFLIFIKIFITSFLLTFNLVAQSKLENAIAKFNEQNYSEAKDIIENILDDDEYNHKAFFYLGRIYMIENEYDEASDYFEEAVELDELNAEYHFLLGQAYGLDARESNPISQAFLAPKIKDEFTRTVELDPSHIGGRIGLINFLIQAPGIMGGDLEEARLQTNTLMELDEFHGRRMLAQIFVQEEKADSAEMQFETLISKFSDSSNISLIYNSYGYLLLNLNKPEKAIDIFKQQVELIPNNANSHDSLGDGYRASGNLEEAARQYRKALELDPNFEPSLKNLQEVLEEIEDSN